MILNVQFKDCAAELTLDMSSGNDTFCAKEFASYVQAHGVVEWDNIINKPTAFPPAITVDEADEAVVIEVG